MYHRTKKRGGYSRYIACTRPKIRISTEKYCVIFPFVICRKMLQHISFSPCDKLHSTSTIFSSLRQITWQYNYIFSIVPSTKTVKLLEAVPASFSATHLYIPLSSGKTSAITSLYVSPSFS